MMKAIIRLALAFVLVALAVPANAACWQWSKTASSNATADPTINWAVGMSPSSVSASGRAMMARIAECRDDVSGRLGTGGTSTAYTLTTNQGIEDPPQGGQLLAFRINVTNGVGATLAVDGGTAYPLQTTEGSGVPAGVLVAGTPYTVAFSSTASSWVLRDFHGAPFEVPLGVLLPYTGTTAPNSNFVLPAGQCISRTTYATYFALVGTTYGGCDGSTTFAVPDLRGKALYALDNLGGSAANILTSTYAGASTTTRGTAIGTESKTIGKTNLPAVALSVTGTASVTSSRSDILVSSGVQGTSGVLGFVGNQTSITSTGSISGTTSNLGSGTPISAVPPGMMMTFILRVL